MVDEISLQTDKDHVGYLVCQELGISNPNSLQLLARIFLCRACFLKVHNVVHVAVAVAWTESKSFLFA